MKKLKSVLNGFMGCGIPSLPKKFTMNRGEGTITALKAPVELISGRRKGLSLTLPTRIHRRNSGKP
jgi:hypothetical protein